MIHPITQNGTFSTHQDGSTWRVDCNGVTVIDAIPSLQYALLVLDALQRLDLPWSIFPVTFDLAEHIEIGEAIHELRNTLEPARKTA